MVQEWAQNRNPRQDCTDSQSAQSGTGARDSRQQLYGFPYTGAMGWCHELKHVVQCSKPFSNEPQSQGADKNIVIQYLGIAADETPRIERHSKKPNIVMPLVDIGWDEALCGLEAKYMGLLAPTYETGTRDGCWFCHNQSVDSLRQLRHEYPDLWTLLLKWDNDSPTTFHADGHTVHDFDKRFKAEDNGLVPTDRTFRWKMLDTFCKNEILKEINE